MSPDKDELRRDQIGGILGNLSSDPLKRERQLKHLGNNLDRISTPRHGSPRYGGDYRPLSDDEAIDLAQQYLDSQSSD